MAVSLTVILSCERTQGAEKQKEIPEANQQHLEWWAGEWTFQSFRNGEPAETLNLVSRLGKGEHGCVFETESFSGVLGWAGQPNTMVEFGSFRDGTHVRSKVKMESQRRLKYEGRDMTADGGPIRFKVVLDVGPDPAVATFSDDYHGDEKQPEFKIVLTRKKK